MAFEINRENVRILVEDSKKNRLKIRDLKIRFYNQLVDLLPSVYVDESASANYSIHLLSLAEEMARLRCALDTVLADVSYEELRSFLLYQNLGSVLGFGPDEGLSHEEYRRLLLAILSVLLGGARAENIKRGVEIFTDFEVRVLEIHKILEEIEEESRRSALNLYDSILTMPNDGAGGNLVLNSDPIYAENFMIGKRPLFFFVDILILDAINPQFIDKGGAVSALLGLVKPAHTEFLLRHIFLEEITVSDIYEEVSTTVQLGTLAPGSSLTDPEVELTPILGPGINLQTHGSSPVVGFIPLTTISI